MDRAAPTSIAFPSSEETWWMWSVSLSVLVSVITCPCLRISVAGALPAVVARRKERREEDDDGRQPGLDHCGPGALVKHSNDLQLFRRACLASSGSASGYHGRLFIRSSYFPGRF